MSHRRILKLILFPTSFLLLNACSGNVDSNGDGVIVNSESEFEYAVTCKSCHGENGGGVLNIQNTTAFEIQRGIANVPGMADIVLTDIEAEGLARFLSGGATNPINDTAIITCGDASITGTITYNNDIDCNASGVTLVDFGDANGDQVVYGQDALYGRDTSPLSTKETDGFGGFSFSKMDSSGAILSNQNQDYATLSWACVRDNVTGLTWEVKTPAGLQSNSYSYTWYNSTGTNDGGDHGIGDTGVSTTTGYEAIGTSTIGSDNCEDSGRCDTEKYVSDVNAAAVCGASNWRLPTTHELNSIVNNNAVTAPTIDATYFPNNGATVSNSFWTSSPFAIDDQYAKHVNFSSGIVLQSFKTTLNKIRLVHD